MPQLSIMGHRDRTLDTNYRNSFKLKVRAGMGAHICLQGWYVPHHSIFINRGGKHSFLTELKL